MKKYKLGINEEYIEIDNKKYKAKTSILTNLNDKYGEKEEIIGEETIEVFRYSYTDKESGTELLYFYTYNDCSQFIDECKKVYEELKAYKNIKEYLDSIDTSILDERFLFFLEHNRESNYEDFESSILFTLCMLELYEELIPTERIEGDKKR